jgi:hypothetical protein
MDDSVRAFGIDEGASVDALRQQIIDRLELKESSCFAVFEARDNWERCLGEDEIPGQVMADWEKEKAEGKFIFKKKIFLRDDEREMDDPVAKNLLYIQARKSVIDSEYPVSAEDAIRLAGLQMQQTYGDHNPSTHTSGFLTKSVKALVPSNLFASKKAGDWDGVILKEHQKHVGKSEEEAITEYLEIVKQFPYYGTTFYPPCKSVGNKKLPAKVIIGVNAEGLILLKTKDKEKISSHLYTEICSWASSSSTFAFEFGSQAESQKYSFETKHGSIIAAAIQTYVDILVQMLKNVEEQD